MRFFPSAGRRLLAAVRPRPESSSLPAWIHPQWVVVYLAVLLAVAGLVAPVARADTDDLKHEQKKVQGQIDKASDHLQESSRRVARVNHRLQTARGNLAAARQRLVRVKAELRQARVRNQRLALRLQKAQAAFETAVAELRAAREEVAVQRDETRDTVIGIATGGNPELAMISSYLESGSVEELMINETGNGVVVGREQHVLTGLVAAEAAMKDQKVKVEAARNAVAASKKAAQETVNRVRVLTADAKSTRNSVARLVAGTRKARQLAVRAKARDRAALQRLEARESRIKQQILAASRRAGGSYSGSTGGLLAAPSGGPVTSPYGYRVHPIYGYYGLHDGTDFGAACGSPLWAGASGTVVNTYYDEVYGNRLYLAIGRVNGDVITLVYNHLSGYKVGEGARVGRGDVLGYAGMTGWSTGCHLHFTVLRNGSPVDPMNYL